ncbi:MAG: DUF5667 domain-containing protein [Jatrophihabitantaceae bacterium]
MSEHRVPVLTGSLRRRSDPMRSNDPAIRDLLSQLRTLEVAPVPRAHFRAELRAQLVAVTPRLVAEGAPDLVRHTPASLEAAEISRTARSPWRAVTDRLPRIHIGRPLGLVTTALAVLALLLGGAVWVSHSSLPGDPLYGLKRASENAQYALTTGDVARSKELLSFAAARAGEVSALLGQTTAMSLDPGVTASDGVGPHTASLITSTLDSANQDVRQAAQMLGSEAVASRSAAPLSTMTSWVPSQATRMQSIVARIPAGALHDRAVASAELVNAAGVRANGLAGSVGCACMATARSDSLGPIPCTDCGTSQSPQPGQPTVTTPTAVPMNSTAAKAGTHSGSASTATKGGTGATGSPTPTPSPTTGTTTPGGLLPPLHLPTLPITIPTMPVTVDSCGLGLNLGGLHVGVGTCGVHLNLGNN